MTDCSRCASALEHGDLRCAVCALPAPAIAMPAGEVRATILRCRDCNAAIAYDAARGAPACAFCGASTHVEAPHDPVEVAQLALPFTVDRDAARRALHGWLGERGFFAPRALAGEATLDSIHPLCWAAWRVSATAEVAWTADSDASAGRSMWAPHAGVDSVELDGLVVSASRGLARRETSALAPHYDFERTIEPPREVAVESFDLQRSAARRQVQAAIEAVAQTRIEPAIPGKRYRNVHVSCVLERQITERVALPAWVMTYRYRGTPYRAIVHGQRADVVIGRAPIDRRKVALMIAAATALAAVIALIAVIANLA
ncbi:MAG TPA: hypothetical protein VH143_03840 [Kofleriaceae bacterium]|nr:hypothetical protein [Kofleriaceae bacterium]